MLEVNFYDINDIKDSLLKYAVIVSKYKGNWLWVKNKKRGKWEIPGGHREENELILETAKRELFEETGAINFFIKPICVYSVMREIETESFGMLFYADIKELGNLPENEIECVDIFQNNPNDLSFPEIQPKLINYVKNILRII
jgi:8-oxo-dGTP diphosphatase